MLRARGPAIVGASACLALLVVAALVRPDSDGYGTHTQLGLPPCGMEAAFGVPCMTCGMTTAFARAADADLLGSFKTQPMGALLAVGCAVCFWGFLTDAVMGTSLSRFAGGLLRARVLWSLAGLTLAAWGYKVAVHTGYLAF